MFTLDLFIASHGDVNANFRLIPHMKNRNFIHLINSLGIVCCWLILFLYYLHYISFRMAGVLWGRRLGTFLLLNDTSSPWRWRWASIPHPWSDGWLLLVRIRCPVGALEWFLSSGSIYAMPYHTGNQPYGVQYKCNYGHFSMKWRDCNIQTSL